MQDPPPNATDESSGTGRSNQSEGWGEQGEPGQRGSRGVRDGGSSSDRSAPTGSSDADDPIETDRPTAADGPGGGDDSGRGIGRRRVLRTVVNAGYGAGIVAAVEGWRVLGTSDEPVSITYALAREDAGGPTGLEARTTTVPARWRNRLERSFEIRDDIADLGLEGIRDLFVVPGSFDSPTGSLSMTVVDGSVRDRLLGRIEPDGVDLDVSILDDVPPFETEESTPSDPVTVDDAHDRTVPGGVLCSVESGMMGSLAPRMYDRETGSPWFATANHLFGARGTLTFEHAGDPMYVRAPNGRNRVAEVDRGYPNEDVVRLEPVDGVRPTSTIHGGARVVGQFTRYGLALLKARGIPLQKVGALSGHTTGTIRGVDGITCYFGDVCKEGQLKWGDQSSTTDGDSGSVNYARDPENPESGVLVGGFNNARTWWPGSNFAWGTGAHHLTAAQGLHF